MSKVLDRLSTGTPVLRETDVTLADLFQVLASPIRLSVVRLLLDGERCVGDLIEELGIAQPRLSNHLACLRNCGLVRTRRQGNFVYYAIADPRVVEIVRMGEALAALNAQELAGCDVLQQERS
jgi:DNA-binding transcriptional ArsR family regulator